MNPYGFWGTLDMFVGHENKRTGKDVLDDVGSWLSTLKTEGAPDGNYRLRYISLVAVVVIIALCSRFPVQQTVGECLVTDRLEKAQQ
jgi:hypothetical protein